jgi:hypothetical protein
MVARHHVPMLSTSPRRLLTAAAIFLVLGGCDPLAVAPSASSPPSRTASTVRWPRPADTLDRAVVAGLVPEVNEHLEYHVHAHLDVFVDGQPIVVPAGIGINIDDPEVKHFENPVAYGGIRLCSAPCISPLHTHAESGVLHTESATVTPNTLGQFFDEWGVALSKTCIGDLCDKPIAFYLNGVPYTGDPRAIELANQREIAIVVGTPPAVIPVTADFSQD